MTAINWLDAMGGDFGTGSNWSGGVVPAATDDAIFGALDGSDYVVVSDLGYQRRDTYYRKVSSIQTASNVTFDIRDYNGFTASLGTGPGENEGTIGIFTSLSLGGSSYNAGSINAESSNSRLNTVGSAILTGGGSINMPGSGIQYMLSVNGKLENLNNTINDAYFDSVTKNDSDGIIQNSIIDYDVSNGGLVENSQISSDYNAAINTGIFKDDNIYRSVDNSGIIEFTASLPAKLENIQRETVNNIFGGVVLADGGHLQLNDDTLIGGTLATDAHGAITISADNVASTLIGTIGVAAGSSINLDGTIINEGTVRVSGAGATTTLRIGATPVYLTGKGAVVLSGAADRIQGSVAADLLVNDDNTISGSGKIGLGKLTLVNRIDATIEAIGGALLLDTGANPVENAGTLGDVSGGALTVASALDNTGLLMAGAGGTSLVVDGAVSGAGSVSIAGGLADFKSSFSQAVGFTGAGVLELADSQAYAGAVSGFSTAGAALDLDDIAFSASTTASYSGSASSGVLSITDGTGTTTIKLSGDYRSASFSVASDGHGGTRVTDATASAQAAHPLIAAIASFGAPASGTASALAGVMERNHAVQLAGPLLRPA